MKRSATRAIRTFKSFCADTERKEKGKRKKRKGNFATSRATVLPLTFLLLPSESHAKINQAYWLKRATGWLAGSDRDRGSGPPDSECLRHSESFRESYTPAFPFRRRQRPARRIGSQARGRAHRQSGSHQTAEPFGGRHRT